MLASIFKNDQEQFQIKKNTNYERYRYFDSVDGNLNNRSELVITDLLQR